MAWQIDSDVWVERDENGFARHLRHIQSPFFMAEKADAYELALQYLRAVGDEFGVTSQQTDHLAQTIPETPSSSGEGAISRDRGEQLRWWRYRELRGETTVLVIQQTHDVPVRLRIDIPFPMDVTSLVLNVLGSALRIVVHRQADGTQVITGATSTLRHNFNFAHAAALADVTQMAMGETESRRGRRTAEAEAGVPRAQGFITAESGQVLLAQMLERAGLAPDAWPADYGFWIYRYEKGKAAHSRTGAPSLHRRQHSELVPGSDYAAMIMRHAPFGYDDDFRVGLDSPPVDIVSRMPDATVLAAVPLMAGAEPRPASGMVFPVDPVTAGGYDLPSSPRSDRTLRPNRPSSELNVARRRVPLARLDPPAGTPLRQHLRGSNVVVVEPGEVDIGSIGVVPPSQPAGRAFDFDARSNDFAAVNAYYHLDAMLHRLELFGMPFATYAPGFNPKVEVIHRAAIRPGPGGDGRCINAQVRIWPGQQKAAPNALGDPTLHKLEFRFALADLPPSPEVEPLGIACDVRWVWHEFGHALIAGATGDLELPFAHSVGDGLAAINCDPASALAEPAWAGWNLRGVTFPWVTQPNRRHDREASLGWSWSGRLGQAAHYHQDHGDVAGYHREQVLSSTLFRLYRALGGDAVDGTGGPAIERRRRAADYVTFLIVRALASLGPASAAPALNASVLASALMDADRGTLVFDYPGLGPNPASQRRVGGAVHKVIRWAFEKQGLYARDGATAHGAGAPEPVDVYLDDGRKGEYQFTDTWMATPQALWLRHHSDGNPTPQAPRRNVDNYIYLRVCNRGYETARAVQAVVRVAASSATLGWPDAKQWTSLAPVTPAAAVSDLAANDHIVLGPFVWNPTGRGDHTILVSIEATGDRSNLDVTTGLPCAQPAAETTPLRRLVPYDNNLATAVWTVP